ncbi:uncharacterized protein LOC144911081 [Branchiostoma floridae x Branchiostoma belcheri]
MGSFYLPTVLCAIALLVVETNGQSCNPGTQYYNGHCYWFSPYGLNYASARTTCQYSGGRLAVIPDSATNTWIQQQLTAASAPSHWVGLDDLVDDSTFVWADGTELTAGSFEDWKDPSGNAQSRDCVILDAGSQYQWAVTECARRPQRFICQSDLPTSFEYQTLEAKLEELKEAMPESFRELGLDDLQRDISELQTVDLGRRPDKLGKFSENWEVTGPQTVLAYDSGDCDATFAFSDPEISGLSGNPVESLRSLNEKVARIGEAVPATAREALPNVREHLADLINNTDWEEVRATLPESHEPDRNITAPRGEVASDADILQAYNVEEISQLRVKRQLFNWHNEYKVMVLNHYWSWVYFPWGWWWWHPRVIIIIHCCPIRIYIIIRWPWIWWPWHKYCEYGWTRWFDRDNPSGTGDWETLTDLRNENPGQICDNPSGIEARVVGTGTPAAVTGDTFTHFNVFSGFVCQPTTCHDYEVRFWCPQQSFPVPCDCPGWTAWFDVDDPTVTGDWEYLSIVDTLNPGQACAMASGIQVKTTVGDVPAGLTGEVFHRFGPNPGFVCRKNPEGGPENTPAPYQCRDYEVRFKCP